jgi:RNA polymerase sigma-70 factor (ECF subfamily)
VLIPIGQPQGTAAIGEDAGTVVSLRDGGDLELVPGFGPPGQTSFEEFYSAHFQALTIQLYAYTRDLAGAQDIAQEAFCRALARWKRLADYDDPSAWVRRVAWNLVTSRWRRTRTAALFLRQQRQAHVAEPSPDRVALAHALATLKPDHRRAVILHYLADLPIAEIARQEGVSENTVKSWLHRARAALATQLSEEEADRA